MTAVNIPTPPGIFRAIFSERGLVRLEMPGQSGIARPDGHDEAEANPPFLRRWRATTVAALEETLAGRRAGALPPLDWSGATAFQQQVWSAMLKIKPGQTMTYSAIAAAIGKPRATRAVGSACGANPIPVLVPCHRVVAAGGKLGGFSAGLDWKRRLLAAEGVASFPNSN
jgi:O-6-methylguanine DNA methyltransferase